MEDRNTGSETAFEDIARIEDLKERESGIEALVSRMSLEEKVEQMAGHMNRLDSIRMAFEYNFKPFPAGGNERLGIPPIMFTDGPRGVALDHSTCFPVSMSRGATWDPDLEERVGSAMGVEARSQGANFSGGVCVNILRHPGWGRAQETFGEDPFHVGVMGSATVRGMQRHIMACAKHYACNSIEESRFYVDVLVDERTLREVYLPHFKRCVDAGVASIMSAYNKVNGEYCAHNRHLLRDILKGDWGFEGFVMSDFIFGTRGTVEAAVGGLDLEMPERWHFGRRLKRAVVKGKVPAEAVDEALTRIIRQKARFAKVGEPGAYGLDKVACREHAELALEAARKGIVLLKNDSRVLPLDRGAIDRLAVIGRLAEAPNLGDRGSSRVRPPYTITPLQGLHDGAGESVEVVYESGGDRAAALEVARRADAVIVVAGLTGADEGEAMPVIKLGGDREDLRLSEDDERLIREVSAVSERCIVVVEGGSAVVMENWRDRVQAILMAWYPGMEGGNAIADVVFGFVNPSGKLPITFPSSTDQLPYFDKRAKSIEYGYYHGYRLFERNAVEPAFPFGFGLSYTEYRYSNLRLSSDVVGKGGKVTLEVDVTNTGERAGEEIVQLYAGYRSSAVNRPAKDLKGFTRLALEPGETATASIELQAVDLAYFDTASSEWVVEEIEYPVYAGPSSRGSDLLEASFRVSGP
jgi:beta-glucosidase